MNDKKVTMDYLKVSNMQIDEDASTQVSKNDNEKNMLEQELMLGQEATTEAFAQPSEQIIEDRAMGCILGAVTADACGSFLEFKTGISQVKMNECMEMPGGGMYFPNIGAGQGTDDSEMATCLMNALIQSNLYKKEGVASINTEQIGLGYREWAYSSPFDMGNTIRTAFAPFEEKVNTDFTKRVYAQVEKKNQNSMSNGALMRITPMAVWASNLGLEDFKNAIVSDVQFTHSNEMVKRAVLAYSVGIKYLLNNAAEKDRAKKCFEFVKDFSK